MASTIDQRRAATGTDTAGSGLDPESKALAVEENMRKTDLNDGTDTFVPKGDELSPPPKADPFSARKAIFARSNRRTQTETETTAANNGEVDELTKAMSEEMAVRAEAEAAGLDPDEAHRRFIANGHQRPAGTKQPTGTQPSQPPVASAEQYATLTYQGRQITVSQRDVDAAGGPASYLRTRQLDEQEGNLAAQAAEMQARQAEIQRAEADLNRRREEQAQREAAVGQGAPANVPGSTPGQGVSPAASAESIHTRAKGLVEKMFSGDPADAEAALSEVLTEIAQLGRGIPTAEQAAQLAADKLRATHPELTQPKPQTETARPTVIDPRWERQRLAINAMAENEFPDVAHDLEATGRVRDRIQQMYKDPRNRDRLAIDVAREACQLEQQAMQRNTRIEMKQGLPGAPSAGGAAPAPEQDQPATGSNYVKLLQSRRPGANRNQ